MLMTTFLIADTIFRITHLYHTTWVPHYQTLLPVTRENIVPRYLIGCRANGDMQLRDTEGRIFNDVSLCSACVLTENAFSRVAKLKKWGC
ncbi:hypothetical protein CDAR_372911 [Caerostris darwini]|uniref:Secreted protein n=1 Tax=Caerostris darwini TaxID=1538125 RepID=A0AAV4RVE0_9ARAC|nr:hypothetical protein CDAR_372801 [Caerostris darwini]GIY24444.1 hypothetical protein CDAR_372911 [Caerostris darwini]